MINYEFFKKKADIQHRVKIELAPERGGIFDRNNRAFAVDTPIESLYAVPREITNKEEVIRSICELIDVDENIVRERINKDKAFIWIKRGLSSEETTRIKISKINGLYLLQETKRSYPKGDLLCHVIGFTDIDNKGIEGIELYYENFLRGKYGWKSFFRDARQNKISSYEEFLPAKKGYDIILTIDEVIQHTVETEMRELVKKRKPESAMIIVMSPITGEIYAMCSYPSYENNQYSKAEKEDLKNRCITDVYEPGSVFKVLSACADIDTGKVKPDDMFFCENGQYSVGKRVLHDYHGYGNLSFSQVIQKSSNIGTVKATAKIGEDDFYNYLLNFGIGQSTGIDLPGEENGILRNVRTWTPSDMTTIPMGQGVSCTTLQLADALSVVANGGLLMQPYIVKEIRDENGNVIKKFKPKIKKRVISGKSADTVKEILKGAVQSGTGKKAILNGYYACGKTGTAQKVIGGRYAEGKYIASFMGFAPYKDPELVVVVSVNEPKGDYFGGSVAAPVFREVMQKSLRYLEVPEES